MAHDQTTLTLLPSPIGGTWHHDYGCDVLKLQLMGEGSKTTLKAKNKLRFIDGPLARLKTKKDEHFFEAHAWDMTNSMFCLWLVNVIELKLCMSVAHLDVTKLIWEDMRKHYALANTPKIH